MPASRMSREFVFRGEGSAFAQAAIWELRQVAGRWRVARTLNRWVT